MSKGMSEGMVMILSNSLTTLRPVFSRLNLLPTTISMSCLSLSVKVGKLKEAQQKMRSTKVSLKSTSLGMAQVKGPTTTTSTKKVGGQGRGNATTRAFMVKARTLVFTGVENLLLLKQTITPTIISKGSDLFNPQTKEYEYP